MIRCILEVWNLPQLNGLKLLAEIRRDERSAATPVLLVVSNLSPGDLREIIYQILREEGRQEAPPETTAQSKSA